MATQKYLKLLREAQETKIKLTNESIKEIRDLYKSVYKKICKDLELSNEGTLNERWLQEYKKELLNTQVSDYFQVQLKGLDYV